MEVGFQLSYAAVLGIVIIQPWLSQFFYSRYWLIQKIWEISTVSIAAQLGTFPLGLLYFHQFPNYFLFSNLFVIPLATLILFSGIGFLIIHKIPMMNNFFALILEHLIKLLNQLVFWVDSLPHAMQKNIHFTVFDTWLSYIIITGFILLIVTRKFKALATSLVGLIVFFSTSAITKFNSFNQQKIIINHVSKQSLVQFIEGSTSFIYCSDTSFIGSENYLFHTANFHTQNHIKNVSFITENSKKNTSLSYTRNPFYLFLNKKIILLDSSLISSAGNEQLDVDFVLFQNSCKLDLEAVKSMFIFLIKSSSMGLYQDIEQNNLLKKPTI